MTKYLAASLASFAARITDGTETILGLVGRVPPDKLGHFAGGVLIYAAAHFASPLIGLAAVTLIAVAKEGYDAAHSDHHTPEVADALATILGGVAGFVCGF